MGPNILGHAPPAVVDALAESLSRGNLFAGQHEDEVALAEIVQAVVPCAERVRFGSSGSEMDQAAIRVARAATGRKLIVKFEGHYHGWFDTLLVSTQPPLDQAGPRDAPTKWYPSAGQSHHAADDLTVLPWNDLDVLTRYLEAHHDEVAGVLMEPICCNTCVIPPRPGYLAGVRALCDRYGVVLIFDEVITGSASPSAARRRASASHPTWRCSPRRLVVAIQSRRLRASGNTWICSPGRCCMVAPITRTP